MKKYITIFILLCLCANSLFGQLKPNVKKLEKSVVVVIALDDNKNTIAFGSGVIIDSKGTCITNYHVLRDAYFVKIKTNKGIEYFMDKITGENESSDLIRFTIKNSSILFAPVTLSKIIPEKGDDVWAMGTPYSMENMNQFSPGIISNTYPDMRFTGDLVFQITAPISHGSSGGGLFNNKGELVGITSFGIGGADAARAALNYAIYVGGISKLQNVYKDRLESAIPVISQKIENPPTPYVPPKYKEPEPPKYEYHPPETGKVSFYTDWPNSISISIDGNYGSTSKYFSYSPPNCGQDGTVSFNLLPGTYSYHAEAGSGYTFYYFNGTVTITANDCKLIKLPAPEKSKTYENSKRQTPKSWMLGVGTSGGTAFYLDKYFRNGKYDLQLSFDGFEYGNSFQNTAYNFNYSWNKYGIGYYRVFSTNEGYIDFALRTGPSIRYLKGIYATDFSFTTTKGNINDFFFNWRLGVDIIIANRILIRGEGGYGYATQGWIVSESVYAVTPYSSDLLNPKFTYDYDLLVGYKFGKLKKRHRIANTLVKHIPELLVPGMTDLKLSKKMLLPKTKSSYATKGRIKMGLFLASAATAIGSNIYSNSEYSKYTNGDPNTNMSHYNNANLAHKIALTSSAVVVSLYLNDIVHFCAKIKTIKNQ